MVEQEGRGAEMSTSRCEWIGVRLIEGGCLARVSVRVCWKTHETARAFWGVWGV